MPLRTCSALALIAGITLVQLPSGARTQPLRLSLAQERAAAKAAGIELSIAALSPPRPPDNENAAPLYREFDRIAIADIRANSSPNPFDDKPGPWQLHEQLLEDAGAHPGKVTESQWKEVGSTLTSRGAQIALVRKAAARRTCYLGAPSSSFSGETDRVADTTFPAYAAMREAARLLVSEAMWESHVQRQTDAIADLALCLRMGRQLQDDRGIISGLVAEAIDSIALSGFRNVLRSHGDDASACRSVVAAINDNWQVTAASQCLRFEIAQGQGEVDYLQTLRPADVYQTKPLPTTAAYKRVVADYGAFALAQMRRCLPLVDKPYGESAVPLRAIEHEIDVRYPESTPFRAAFLGWAEGNFHRDTLANSVRITETGAAVLSYRAEYGEFPAELADAMPHPPMDAFDGKPLHYEVTPTGFVISATHQRPGHEPEPATFRYPL